jgi:hypothetical protein
MPTQGKCLFKRKAVDLKGECVQQDLLSPFSGYEQQAAHNLNYYMYLQSQGNSNQHHPNHPLASHYHHNAV